MRCRATARSSRSSRATCCGDIGEIYGRYTGDIREILLEQVEQGDLLRAVTAYAAVAGDAPMWQQVISPLDLP